MKAYLSSTYADLEKYRRRAYEELRGLEFDVLAMEDYGAADERPLDRCLADVERSDLYVGIFAHRYGHIPDAENPKRRSITELEYRHAVAHNIPRLIFMVPADAKWERQFDDAITGDGNRGERIANLREELAKNRLLKEFTTPGELAAAVASSASRWLRDRQGTSWTGANPSQPASRHPRELLFDLLILHAPSDSDSAAALAEALPWKVTRSEAGLVAASRDDLRDLDRLAASARSAAVLLSPSALTVLAEDTARSRRALRLARDRSGEFFAVALEEISSDDADAWELNSVVGPASATDAHGPPSLAQLVHLALAERLPNLEVPMVGLPMVFVAMTATEAASLLADPPLAVGPLLDLAGGPDVPWIDRYGQTRSAWKPFGDETIEQVLSAAVAKVNQDANRLRGRAIRLQPYQLDEAQDLDMWPIYRDIARRGCLVVVDELSLFHEGVRQAFVTSPLRDGEQVAFVTLSPFDPTVGSPLAEIHKQLDEYLAQAARRFGEVFDPLCEMGIPERRRLDRWLYGSLPRAIEVLREARQDPEKLQEFSEELDKRPNPELGRLVAGEGGPT
jgi:hypothetical protein